MTTKKLPANGLVAQIRTKWQSEKNRPAHPLSPYLFRNYSKLGDNLAGWQELRKARRAYAGPSNLRLRYKYWRSRSVAVPPSVFETIDVRGLCKLLSDRLDDDAYSVNTKGPGLRGIPDQAFQGYYRRIIRNSFQRCPEVATFFTSAFIDFLRSCLASNFSLIQVDIYRNHHVPSQVASKYEILSDRWHMDRIGRTDRFKVFVNLTHVTGDDGPFHWIDATQSRRLIGLGYNLAKRKQHHAGGVNPLHFERNKKLFRLVGPPGTAAICNTNFCFHRAGVPEPARYRDILALRFEPSKRLDLAPTDPGSDEDE